MSSFVKRNKPDWDELEGLIAKARRSRKRMTPEQLSRMDQLYRRTTVHLARVSSRTTDRKLTTYLNNLAASAHSQIYTPPRESLLKGTLWFIGEGFARSIVRNGWYHFVSLGLLIAGGLVAYFAARHDTMVAYALWSPADPRQPGASADQLLEVLRGNRDWEGGMKFAFASLLFTHNLQVGVLSMALGVLAAIPTVLLIFYNGMVLGVFVAIHHEAGINAEMWAWILPHGVTEIGAIILCGGVGLLLGRAVVSPGLQSRSQALRAAGREAAATALGIGFMLLLAAVIESYLRQSHLSTTARLSFAIATAVFWMAFIVHGYLRERASAQARLGDET